MNETDAKLTLYLRNAGRLKILNPTRERVIDVDVKDVENLKEAVSVQDIVYANLGGLDIVQQTESIVEAMKATSVKGLFYQQFRGL